MTVKASDAVKGFFSGSTQQDRLVEKDVLQMPKPQSSPRKDDRKTNIMNLNVKKLNEEVDKLQIVKMSARGCC